MKQNIWLKYKLQSFFQFQTRGNKFVQTKAKKSKNNSIT